MRYLAIFSFEKIYVESRRERANCLVFVARVLSRTWKIRWPSASELRRGRDPLFACRRATKGSWRLLRWEVFEGEARQEAALDWGHAVAERRSCSRVLVPSNLSAELVRGWHDEIPDMVRA
jgi:hypothetical protein